MASADRPVESAAFATDKTPCPCCGTYPCQRPSAASQHNAATGHPDFYIDGKPYEGECIYPELQHLLDADRGWHLRRRRQMQSWGRGRILYKTGSIWVYPERGSFEVIWKWGEHHYAARLVWRGRMGYTSRWRWLAPISTRFKIGRFEDNG